MGYEYVKLVQLKNRKMRNKENRELSFRKQVKASIITVLVTIMVVSLANVDLIKAHAQAGHIVSFESRMAKTEDDGLTVVIHGGKADGHVWDVPVDKAKYFEDGTYVEVVFNNMGTADVTDDEIIKVSKAW